MASLHVHILNVLSLCTETPHMMFIIIFEWLNVSSGDNYVERTSGPSLVPVSSTALIGLIQQLAAALLMVSLCVSLCFQKPGKHLQHDSTELHKQISVFMHRP